MLQHNPSESIKYIMSVVSSKFLKTHNHSQYPKDHNTVTVALNLLFMQIKEKQMKDYQTTKNQ